MCFKILLIGTVHVVKLDNKENSMFHHVGKKIFLLMLFVSLVVASASAVENKNLSNTQLNSVMGVVTNMILASDIDEPLNLVYPPSSQFNPIKTINISTPKYLESYIDPVFETKVTKVTEKNYFNYATTPTHPYPKTQAWNSDGTYLRIRNTIIDGNTYSPLFDIFYMNEMKWSHLDSNTIYGITNMAKGRFAKQNIKTGDIHIIKEFDGYEKVLIGPYEGNMDWSDDKLVLSAKSNNDLIAIVYSIETSATVATKTFPDIWDKLDWVTISPSGEYILMNWIDGQGEGEEVNSIYLYDKYLNFIRVLSTQGQHGDLGYNKKGDEVYVQFEFGAANLGVWSYTLKDVGRTQELPNKYGGGHISCQNYLRKGWCYISTNQEEYKEVYALKLDGSGMVQRFAQHHQKSSARGSPSPDGTKIIFQSTFDDTTDLSSFVVEMK